MNRRPGRVRLLATALILMFNGRTVPVLGGATLMSHLRVGNTVCGGMQLRLRGGVQGVLEKGYRSKQELMEELQVGLCEVFC